jgi:hypothetical protein
MMNREKKRSSLLPAWSLACSLILANLVLHKPFSNLCDAAYARIGRIAYERAALLAITAVSAAAAVPLVVRNGRALLRPATLARLATLGAITIAAQQLLLVSNIELIHFPQFALLAAVFLAGGLPLEAAWLAATAAGVLDETYQHLVIYAGAPDTYLDFNDMLLNAIGAAWPVVLWAAASPSSNAAAAVADGLRHWRRWAVGLAVLAAALLWWHDPPGFTPLLRRAATGRFYRVLSAPEGIAAIGFVWFLVLGAVRARPVAERHPLGAEEQRRSTEPPPLPAP